MTVNGQSSSIMSVLVLGAGTDYALLLVARYREELRQRRRTSTRRCAIALRASGPGDLRLRRSTVDRWRCCASRSPRSTAPPASARSARSASLTAMVAMLTLLPALLAIFGRRAFWPFVPYGPDGAEAPDAHAGPVAHRAAAWASRLAMLLQRRHPRRRAGGRRACPAPLTLGAVLVASIVLRVAGGPFTARFRSTEHRFSDVARADRRHARPLAPRGRLDRRAPAAGRGSCTTPCCSSSWRSASLNYSTGLTQGNSFRGDVESVAGPGAALARRSRAATTPRPTSSCPTRRRSPRSSARSSDVPGVAAVRAVEEGAPATLPARPRSSSTRTRPRPTT